MESQTIRIVALTSVSCSVRSKLKSKFSVDFIGYACWTLLQQRVFVGHWQNVTDFTQIFDSRCLFNMLTFALLNFACIHYIRRKISTKQHCKYFHLLLFSKCSNGLVRLSECNDEVKHHLIGCHLSKEVLGENELILTRTGLFYLAQEDKQKNVDLL